MGLKERLFMGTASTREVDCVGRVLHYAIDTDVVARKFAKFDKPLFSSYKKPHQN